MADLISHPFRLSSTGGVVTRPEDSSEYYGELLAVMVGTTEGEREDVPLFGITDPTFGHLDEQQLESKVDIFGPPVQIVNVSITQVTETDQHVVIEFAVRQRTS